MANLLDLPEEVVESSILPHLSWNELLRCRRVCKYIKAITEDFLQVNAEIAPEIEISEDSTEKNLKALIDLGISTTKLYINNPTGYEFFDNLNVNTLNIFVETYGARIKSLRLRQLSLCPCFNEWTFLESLSTLETLQADFIGYGVVRSTDECATLSRRMFIRAQSDPRFGVRYFPDHFNNSLKVIKIGNEGSMGYQIGNIQKRVPRILDMCQNLEYISLPVCLHYDAVLYFPPGHEFSKAHEVLIEMFTEFISSIVAKNGRKHVKFIDFENYHVAETIQIHMAHCMASPYFLALCRLCNTSGVKLLNVQPMWLSERLNQTDPTLKSVELGNPVVSLVNLDPCVFPLNMPNLEKIDIRQPTHSSVSEDGVAFRRPLWNSLNILNINVDKTSEKVMNTRGFALLFDFFFKNIVRIQLSELNITFETERKVECPKTEDIAKSCPNLKKLKISNWPGTNKAITKLWIGLLALEQVTLENCTKLGNVAFVGEDVGNPVFLSLKNLTKLTLIGLDQMPKITDTLFSLVLARMKLPRLILTSEKPLIKVTKVGIDALLKGAEFSQSIERFPFHGWSVADLTSAEFQELGQKFRSFQMV